MEKVTKVEPANRIENWPHYVRRNFAKKIAHQGVPSFTDSKAQTAKIPGDGAEVYSYLISEDEPGQNFNKRG